MQENSQKARVELDAITASSSELDNPIPSFAPTKISPRSFYMSMPWEWADLDGSESKRFVYSLAGKAVGADGLYISDYHPSAESFHEMIYVGKRYGYCEQVNYLYQAFRYNFDEIYNKYELETDGRIHVESLWGVSSTYSNISALFTNIVASGRHLTERMGALLASTYGRGSSESRTWRWYSSTFYDQLLGYALCDRYRNPALHSFMMLSIVNYRPSSYSVGVTINLESGLLSKNGWGANLSARLLAFRQDRREQGLNPWFSLNTVLKEYDLGITCLYIIFSRILLDDIANNPLSAKTQSEIGSFDSLFWSDAALEKPYSTARSYMIATDVEARAVRRRLLGASSHVRSIDDRMGDTMKSIAAGKAKYMLDEDDTIGTV